MTQIVFENDVVSVALPDGWVDRSDGDDLAFENPAESEDLIVSLGQFRERMEAAALAQVVGKLLQHKIAAMGQVSAGALKIHETSQPPPGTPYVAGFSGYDSRNSIFSSVRVSANVEHFCSASYYLHGCKIVTSETATRAKAVLDMCQHRVTTA